LGQRTPASRGGAQTIAALGIKVKLAASGALQSLPLNETFLTALTLKLNGDRIMALAR
jgi:hypothetical protein